MNRPACRSGIGAMPQFSADQMEKIYRECREPLFVLAYSVIGCEQLAEDAIHEAFVTVCASDRVIKDPVAYLYTSVRHAAIDASRRNKRQRSAEESLFNGHIPPSRTTMEDSATLVLDRERDQVLRQAIDHLAIDHREVIILRCFAGLTFDQIAAVTESPTKTVDSRYRRALAKLNECLRGKL